MRISKIILGTLLLLTVSVQSGMCQRSFGGGMKVKTKSAKSYGDFVDRGNARAKMLKFTGKSNINPMVAPKFYRGVRKVFGRFVGVGDEIAATDRHCYNVLYKFSEQNIAGSWTKIEALDFKGEHTTSHTIGTYLLNQNDEGDSEANKEWREKLKSVCQWSVMYDATGLTVVQERAYDAEGNLVFTYSPMKISDNEVVGAYANCWGIPVNLRGEHGTTLVKIRWDENGNEVEHLFVDEKGRLVRNQNGAFINRFEYDAAGNQVLNVSCDEFGDPMMDNCGNCGWRALYDQAGDQTVCYYFDSKMNRMRMPASDRTKSSDYQGVSMISREYDKWHRVTSETFSDEKGEPDTNAFGCHRVVLEYDHNGNQTWCRYYGVDGKTCGNSSLNGAGIVHRAYDRWGNLCMVEFFGRDTTERVNGGSDEAWCKWVSHNVTQDGDYDSYYEYKMKEGMMVCRYSEEKRGHVTTTVFPDKTVRVDSFDETGYQVAETHLDRKGEPYEPSDYHRRQSSRQKIGQKVILTRTEWFDKMGRAANHNGVAVEEVEVDSLRRTVRVRQTNANGIMVHHFRTYRNADWKIVRQEVLNGFGNNARTLREGTYYAIETKLSFDGGISDMYSKNEFGEPAYDNNGGTLYCHRRQMGDSVICYDEHGSVIRDINSFRSRLPVAFVVEVTDSVGYRNGLRDGDVILQYGNWRYDLTRPENVKVMFRGDINAAFIAEASREKSMTLLRHDTTRGESEVVVLQLGKGTTGALGFVSHPVYYTAKEYARLQNALNRYVDKNGLRKTWRNEKSRESRYYCIVPQCQNSVAAQLLYNRGIAEPMIVLAVDRYEAGDNMNVPPTAGNQWTTGEETEMMDAILWNRDNANVVKHLFYVTKDGVSIDTLAFQFDNAKYQRVKTLANEEVFVVEYDAQFGERVKSLMARLNSGECGFRKSDEQQSMEYITLDDMLGSEAYARMCEVTLKDGNNAFDAILYMSELRKSAVDSISILSINVRDMKMMRRLKGVMDGYDVSCSMVDGCLIYECCVGKQLRKLLMLRLDGANFSMMMHCNVNLADFNPLKFVHSLDEVASSPKSDIVEIIKIEQQAEVGDKTKRLNGEYVMMEFEGWNMYESKNELRSAIRMAEGKRRPCLIAPIKRDKAGNVVRVGKPEIRYVDGYADWELKVDDTIDCTVIAVAYEKWKQTKTH